MTHRTFVDSNIWLYAKTLFFAIVLFSGCGTQEPQAIKKQTDQKKTTVPNTVAPVSVDPWNDSKWPSDCAPSATAPMNDNLNDDLEWRWVNTPSKTNMKVEVVFDKKIIFQSSFPVQFVHRKTAPESGSFNFSFLASRKIQWDGYFEHRKITPPKTKFEGDIWLAGGDKKYMILGVIFSTDKQRYMNTLHLAYINKTEISQIANGLFIRTTPMTTKK